MNESELRFIIIMSKITDDLQAIATPQRAETSAWFFKTGKGQYGEGDIFIGVSNPDLRAVCKKYISLKFDELQELIEKIDINLFKLSKKEKINYLNKINNKI